MAVLAICALLALGSSLSDFDRYPSRNHFVGFPAPLVSTAKVRKHKTVLEQAVRDGANFNGYYRVAWWGCGTNCVEWAVINLKTGVVWFAAEPALSCFAAADNTGSSPHETLETRVSSKLFYLYFCDPPFRGDRTFNMRRVYVWSGSTPQLIRTERVDK